MAQRDQNIYQESVSGGKTNKEQEDDYDTYLFWPSLSNRDVSSGASPSSPLYGPVSLHSDSTDYDYYSMLSSGPPSPLTFAPVLGCRSPSPVEDPLYLGTARRDEPEAEAQKPKEENSLAKYSTIFKMGLLFAQMTHCVDRALEGVKIRLRKPKSRAQ